eukprot:62963_1
MLFEPLSLHKYCKHYILISCIWCLLIIFAINGIIGVNAHNKHNITFNESILNSNIFGHLSIYEFILYSISFCFILSLSCTALYIIQIHSKSYISILSQTIFCCKCQYWKLICDKKYKIRQTKHSTFNKHLLSSEIMSEFNVENETELQTKFLSEVNENNAFSHENNNEITDKPNICLAIYTQFSSWYHNMYSAHKFLLLLVVLNVSFLLCFIILTVMDIAGTGHSLPRDNYELVMIVWLIVCFIIKLWMKFIGKHIDIIRLDMKLKYGTDSNVKKRIYDLTKRLSNLPTTNFGQESSDLMSMKPYSSVTVTTDEELQNEVNDFTFDISFEIVMEIFMQITYYSFYRDYSFIFSNPTWTQFLIFKIIHLLTIFMLYFIRIMPFYYQYTSKVFRADLKHASNVKYKDTMTVSTINYKSPQKINEANALSPEPSDIMFSYTNSVDEQKGNVLDLNKEVSGDYYNDADTIQINALDNIFEFYNRENNMKSYQKSVSDKKSIFNGINVTFETYIDWRNRICIDCVIRCIVMIFTAITSYCTVGIYYKTGNYRFLGESFDTKQFETATYYFIISLVSELILYGSLYLFMIRRDNDSFNIFQPFASLYAKSTHCHHYAILFVVCALWLY